MAFVNISKYKINIFEKNTCSLLESKSIKSLVGKENQ